MGDILTRTLKNGRVAFYARYVELDGKRTSKATKAKTEEDAQKWLETAEARVAEGLPGDKLGAAKAKARAERERKAAEKATTIAAEEAARNRLTVRQLAERFVGKADGFKSGHGSEARNPVKYRRQTWSVLHKHALPHLGDLFVDSVRRSDVKGMKRALLAAKKSNRIVQKALRVTSKMFNWAIDDAEIIDRDNPAARAGAPKCPSSKSFYTEDEVARLLAWAAEHAPDLHPIIAFAYYTGARKGEIAALRWSDIDWQGRKVHIHASWDATARKSGEDVSPNLHPHLVAILEAWREQAGGEGDALVFPDPATGGMRPQFNHRVVMKQEARRTSLWGLDVAIAGAKVRRFKSPWHAFRHTNGTALATAGAPEADIKNSLGQSTGTAAQSYIHTAAANAKKYLDQMPAIGPIRSVVSLDAVRAKRMDTERIRSEKQADMAAGGTREK